MSQRVLVELNLDYFHDIERNSEQFVRTLTGAVLHHDEASLTNARNHFGVRRLDQHHHSDAVTIFVNGHVVWEEGLAPYREVAGSSLVDRLRNVVFTAARNWARSVRLSREDRDRIVAALEARGDRR